MMAAIRDRLAVRLRVSHAAEGARIRMQLEPRELGEVVIRLEIQHGVAHAHLIAESADAGDEIGKVRLALLLDPGLEVSGQNLVHDLIEPLLGGQGALDGDELAIGNFCYRVQLGRGEQRAEDAALESSDVPVALTEDGAEAALKKLRAGA